MSANESAPHDEPEVWVDPDHEPYRDSLDWKRVVPQSAPSERPIWQICDRCQIADHDGCTMPETNEECCCGA